MSDADGEADAETARDDDPAGTVVERDGDRVALPLVAILNGAWLLRVTAFADEPWPGSATVGSIPGWLVIAAVAVLFAGCLVVAFRPMDVARARRTPGDRTAETPGRRPGREPRRFP